MLIAVTLVAAEPANIWDLAGQLTAGLANPSWVFAQVTALGPAALDLIVEAENVAGLRQAVDATLVDAAVDYCIQPAEGRRKRLLIADMDSTIIGCECLDELADFAGVKAQVSAITERAMRGEIGFEGALRERVAMLKGLPLEALQTCFDERVRLNPGARVLLSTMAGHGARCLLVSGGFEFFTERVAALAGFHAQRANRLIEADGVLTGAVGEPILGREAKLEALRRETEALELDPAQTLAVGDGANDLDMIRAAGLGVAYRAKPIVAAQAHARIDHTDLTSLLYFQGYPAAAFSS